MLNITEIKIKKINKGKFLGYASVCISDSIVIKEIKLFDGKKGKYIIMPGIRLKEQKRVRNFAFPISDETRIKLLNAIIEKYEEETEDIEN